MRVSCWRNAGCSARRSQGRCIGNPLVEKGRRHRRARGNVPDACMDCALGGLSTPRSFRRVRRGARPAAHKKRPATTKEDGALVLQEVRPVDRAQQPEALVTASQTLSTAFQALVVGSHTRPISGKTGACVVEGRHRARGHTSPSGRDRVLREPSRNTTHALPARWLVGACRCAQPQCRDVRTGVRSSPNDACEEVPARLQATMGRQNWQSGRWAPLRCARGNRG